MLAVPDFHQDQGATRHETDLERLDRNLEELTGELRVTVTGVQVLFAFLLIVPFNAGFAHVGGFERTVYFVTLAFAALSAVCTLAPTAEHRLPVWWWRTLCAAHQVRNASLRVESSPTRSVSARP